MFPVKRIQPQRSNGNIIYIYTLYIYIYYMSYSTSSQDPRVFTALCTSCVGCMIFVDSWGHKIHTWGPAGNIWAGKTTSVSINTKKTSKSSRPLLLERKWNGMNIYMTLHLLDLSVENPMSIFGYGWTLLKGSIFETSVSTACAVDPSCSYMLWCMTCKYGPIQGKM